MNQDEYCQLIYIPKMSEGEVHPENQSWILRMKRKLAVPWNYHVKKLLKKFYRKFKKFKNSSMNVNKQSQTKFMSNQDTQLKAQDIVKVRSLQEIQATLDYFHELKGCAFLPYMADYCETTQIVLQPVQKFLDERDYKVKKTTGVVVLKDVICTGTPVFGRCDRACHLFWREEWLEKIS